MFAEETLVVILNDKLSANKRLGSDQEAFQRRAGDGAGAGSDKLEVLADTAPFPSRQGGNAMCQHLQMKPASLPQTPPGRTANSSESLGFRGGSRPN